MTIVSSETEMTRPLPVLRPSLPSSADILPYLREIDERHWYSNRGPLVTRLEEQIGRHLRLTSGGVVATASATAGISATLLALNVSAGSLCLMPSWTFCATAHAARAAGMTPWFHDIDRRTWALDPDEVREALRQAPGPVGAVIVVSPFGAPLDTPAWEAFEDRTGIPVVIDAAAGFDTARASRIPVVVSLHATKILGAGEGGFVATTASDLRERVAACCNFGFQGSRSANYAGLNGKMSEYHAAIALASLAAWPAMRARHAWIVEWYRRALQQVDGAALQPDYGNGWVGSTTSVILPPGAAKEISGLLLRLGIETRAWWSRGCHVQPAFGDCPRALLPVTEDLGGRVLGLPHFPDMREDDIGRVAEALSEVVGRQNWLPARESVVRRVPSRGVDLYVGGSLGAWALSLVEPRDVVHLITTEPDLADKARERGFRVVLEDKVYIPDTPAADAVSIHYPRVFPASLIDSYRRMYNLHPGYLPWGRGYYPVFWALWGHTPAGATLHCITAGLDKGPIVNQVGVAYTDGDTGGSLHAKVQDAERDLLRAYWPRIMAGEEFSCTPQAAGGSYHSKREFFDLKTHPPYAMMTEGDLVRLALAVEFPGYNGLQIPPGGANCEMPVKSEGQLR